MSLYDNEENAVVNQTPTPSETPSTLVGEGDATIKELSPNPAKFGFTKQVFIDALSDVATPAFDTLYLVRVKDGGVVIGYIPYRYEGSIKGYQRIYNTNEPNNQAAKGVQEQKAVEVNAPRVLYDKNGLPVVTLDDDGDILTVVNGKWQKQTPVPVSSGTKLYAHKIDFVDTDEISGQIEVISTDKNAYTNSFGTNVISYRTGVYNGLSLYIVFANALYASNVITINFSGINENLESFDNTIETNSITDTVTEL